MPLSHFVYEAKKNSLSLGKAVAKEQGTAVSVQEEAQEEAFGEGTELRRAMVELSEAEKSVAEVEKGPAWLSCKHLKRYGEKPMCIQYMSLCAQEKCKKDFMEASFFDYKKYLKQGKTIK